MTTDPTLLPLAWWGPIGALVYTVISLVVGDRFPFSRYAMYAQPQTRDHGAVPVFLADGAQADAATFHRFSGIDASQLWDEALACSLEWQVHELTRWHGDHAADEGDEAGPIAVQAGYRILRLGEDGRLTETLDIRVEGRAWRR